MSLLVLIVDDCLAIALIPFVLFVRLFDTQKLHIMSLLSLSIDTITCTAIIAMLMPDIGVHLQKHHDCLPMFEPACEAASVANITF